MKATYHRSWCIAISGCHKFAEFTAADVGTVESGLNHMVIANNSEMVLLSMNEPTFGTKRKSQIQVEDTNRVKQAVRSISAATNGFVFISHW